MQPIVADAVTWSAHLSVGLSVTVAYVSLVKMAEPTEMPFGLWARVGPRNHVLDRGLDRLMQRENRGGKG